MLPEGKGDTGAPGKKKIRRYRSRASVPKQPKPYIQGIQSEEPAAAEIPGQSFIDSYQDDEGYVTLNDSVESLREEPVEKEDDIELPQSRAAASQIRRLDLADGAGGLIDAFDTEAPVHTSARDEMLQQAQHLSADIEGDNAKNPFIVSDPGLTRVGTPPELIEKLEQVGYQCLDYLAVQISLLLNTPSQKIRALLLEGPSGCGKSFMAKSLAKISGAEFMCLSCYEGMNTQNLIEAPSTLALASAMAGKATDNPEDLLNLGIISRAFKASQEKPVILLIDELDKPHGSIDTFFLGPIQDGVVYLESGPPIRANMENLLIVFTKNFNRKIDDALLRRCHPIKMTYLDSTLERKILSPHCHPQLVANLVAIADRMRDSNGSYQFERPPAPEELLTTGHYITRLVQWCRDDFAFVGKSIWAIIAKSEHDRAVLEHMLRFHPDFVDPLIPDARYVPLEEVYAKLGRLVLAGIKIDPEAEARARAQREMEEEFQ